MRNRVFGAIGVVWGGGIVIYTLVRGLPQGQGAYAVGQTCGVVLGALLLVVGLYYLVKGGG